MPPYFNLYWVGLRKIFQTGISSAFPWKFLRLHARNFQIKIPFLLHDSYVHVFDSLRLNKWCNVRISEVFFGAKYKQFPRGITYCVSFANVSSFFIFMQTHVWYLVPTRITMIEVFCKNRERLSVVNYFRKKKLDVRLGIKCASGLVFMIQRWGNWNELCTTIKRTRR